MEHRDEKDEAAPARSKTAKRMNGGKYYTLQLTRHGATRMNNNDVSVDRLRGWKDIPLSDEGRGEAARLAKSISKNPPDVIYSSDLCRAEETAKIIAEGCGMKLEKATRGFRPWDIGCFVGEKAAKAIPILVKYAIETPDKAVPGGKEGPGESFHTFERRFFGELYKTLSKNPGGVTLVVTHNRSERLLKSWEKEGFPADGTIDKNEFCKKGEAPGHCEILRIPAAKLKAVAGWI